MPLADLDPGARVDAAAGTAVVVGPIGELGDLARCLRSVLAHSPPEVPVLLLVADGAADVRAWLEELAAAEPARTLVVVPGWDAACDAVAPADVVLLHPACTVADGWLAGLRDAADSAGNAATATALSNHAAFASVPRRNLPWGLLPAELTAETAAARVRAASLRLRPRVPRALGHCALVRRPALDLAGALGAGGEADDVLADFSRRCLAHGLQHVLADDVLVAHRGGDEPAGPVPDAELAAAEDRFSALARALSVTSRALRDLTVTVDGRCLTPGMDGTRVHTLELIAALARGGGARVRVVVPENLGDEARTALDRAGPVTRLSEREALDGADRTDVVHRAWQVFTGADLALLDRVGERIVLTNQDLIGYRTPQAFADAGAWLAYRRTTAEALAVASAVLFFSADARDDALADDLVAPDRAHVVPIGVDHRVVEAPAPAPPPAAAELEARPFLLMLGNRFRHKNTVFALRLLEALRDEHGFDGDLVLAGAEPLHGSSSGDEAAFLGPRPALGAHVRELGAVGEAEKRWLLERARAVVYPSAYEGFGLIPFEAATAGTPCLFAHVSALRETLPASAATLVPWDAARSAGPALAALSEPRAGELVAQVAAAGRRLSWDRTAEALMAAYRAAADSPAPAAARLTDHVARVEHDYWAQRDALTPTAVALVGHEDPLLDPETQRALASIASRRGLRGPLRTALRAVARLPPGA